MSALKLKASVDYQPQSDMTVLTITASDGEKEIYVKLASDPDGTSKPSDVSAALRHLAYRIDHTFGDQQVAA